MCEPTARRSLLGGFTLLELLVVLAIIALASAAVTLSLRPGGEQQLEQEARRLVALLEAARQQSQVQGSVVTWRPTAEGFTFSGLPPSSDLPRHWLSRSAPQVTGAVPLVLGPEPLVPAQSLQLRAADDARGHRLEIFTDGLATFDVRTVQP